MSMIRISKGYFLRSNEVLDVQVLEKNHAIVIRTKNGDDYRIQFNKTHDLYVELDNLIEKINRANNEIF